MVQFTSFTRPSQATGTGQSDALVQALLKQALSSGQIRHPAQGFDQLGKSALAAFLMNKQQAEGATEREAKQTALLNALRGPDQTFSEAGPKTFADKGATGLGDVLRGNLPVVSGPQTQLPVPGTGSIDPQLQALAEAGFGDVALTTKLARPDDERKQRKMP